MIIKIILLLFGIILIALSINVNKFKTIYLLVGIVLLIVSSIQFLRYKNTSKSNFSF